MEVETIAGRIIGAVTGAVVVIVIVSVVAVYLGMQYVTPTADTYKISGYVKTDGVALSGAAVTLDGESTTTNSDGYFEFTGLEGNKSYSLSVSKSGYESYNATIQLGTQDLQVSEISLKAEEVAMPLAAIKSVIATRESVSTDNVEVYFCVPSERVENENFATGVVVSDQKSIVFIYNQTTGTITVENEYTATTSDELQAMSTIVLKDVTSPYAQDHLGHFNVNKIVPFGIVKTDGSYTFNYYDGYVEYPVDLWGHGTATLDENGEVTFITHEWIE